MLTPSSTTAPSPRSDSGGFWGAAERLEWVGLEVQAHKCRFWERKGKEVERALPLGMQRVDEGLTVVGVPIGGGGLGGGPATGAASTVAGATAMAPIARPPSDGFTPPRHCSFSAADVPRPDYAAASGGG
ncbi:unnamed protein product [Closterium sp. NIES-53]